MSLSEDFYRDSCLAGRHVAYLADGGCWCRFQEECRRMLDALEAFRRGSVILARPSVGTERCPEGGPPHDWQPFGLLVADCGGLVPTDRCPTCGSLRPADSHATTAAETLDSVHGGRLVEVDIEPESFR